MLNNATVDRDVGVVTSIFNIGISLRDKGRYRKGLNKTETNCGSLEEMEAAYLAYTEGSIKFVEVNHNLYRGDLTPNYYGTTRLRRA